ncbi:hypothetical protein FB451DRAFT_1184363 [Mycena latifolia]|nr:hypothetical protein FB451DRAFT_1184363 [Mycena latifolia]
MGPSESRIGYEKPSRVRILNSVNNATNLNLESISSGHTFERITRISTISIALLKIKTAFWITLSGPSITSRSQILSLDFPGTPRHFARRGSTVQVVQNSDSQSGHTAEAQAHVLMTIVQPISTLDYRVIKICSNLRDLRRPLAVGSNFYQDKTSFNGYPGSRISDSEQQDLSTELDVPFGAFTFKLSAPDLLLQGAIIENGAFESPAKGFAGLGWELNLGTHCSEPESADTGDEEFENG